MSQLTEQEVQLQFLEEAQDYLNEIESGLLGLSKRNGPSTDMDALLRAAHSIKGGAALMGFQVLSDLAHRMEDAFKVLRGQGQAPVAMELEQMLLQAVDGIRKVIFHNRRGVPIDRIWLRSSVIPTFNGLHRTLGDPTPEDETVLVANEAGADMVLMLFESEVGGCLERLDKVLVHPEKPCLVEEVLIAAQELFGLSEMLDLPQFGSLCQSVTDILTATDDVAQKVAIAELAITEWQRVQAMVMVGQADAIPTRLDISAIATPIDLTESEAETFPVLDETSTEEEKQTSDSLTLPDEVESLPLDLLGVELKAAVLSNALADPLTNEETDSPVSECNAMLAAPFGLEPVDDTFEQDAEELLTLNQSELDSVFSELNDSQDVKALPTDVSTDLATSIDIPLVDAIGDGLDRSEDNPSAIAEDGSLEVSPEPNTETLATIETVESSRILDESIAGQESLESDAAELGDLSELNSEAFENFELSEDDLFAIADDLALELEPVLEQSIDAPLKLESDCELEQSDHTLNAAPEDAHSSELSDLSFEEFEGFDVNEDDLSAIADDLASELEDVAQLLAASEEGAHSNPTQTELTALIDESEEPHRLEERVQSAEPEPLAAQDMSLTPDPEDVLPQMDSVPVQAPIVTQTIRVAVQKLQHLGEQCGELVIERNSLRQQLGQMRTLMDSLTERVLTLQQVNHRLRTVYDQVVVNEHSPAQLISAPSGRHNASGSFDTLEMDQYGSVHLISQELMETAIQIQEVTTDVNLHLEEAEQTTRELSRTTKHLQTSMTQIRMRPISDLLSRVPRMMRDLSLSHGKSVNVSIKGGGTLMDRTILEQLNDPLIHLVRNAFDHGIESPEIRKASGKPTEGTIEISAAYRGNQTVITVRDDGGGIPLDKVKSKALTMGIPAEQLNQASEHELLELLFEPGFSTADAVTDLSGRGVGMDVVRHNLQQMRGDISIDTQPGVGTTFTITVPFNLSVVRALLVESQRTLFAFPTDAIEEIVILQPDAVVQEKGHSIFHWEGEKIPLFAFGEVLDFPYLPAMKDTESSPLINQPLVMLVEHQDQVVGIQVDRYWGEQEVTVRQVEGPLLLPLGFAGCTILGDGRIAPLVEVMALLEHLQLGSPPIVQSADELALPLECVIPDQTPTVMVVDDSVNVRRFLALTVEKSGYRVEQAKDGQHALEILQAGLSVQAVITDLEMPRLDGFGLLSHVKSDTSLKHIPVMMLTSRSGPRHRKLAQTLGASAYFAKPFRERELLASLSELIATGNDH